MSRCPAAFGAVLLSLALSPAASGQGRPPARLEVEPAEIDLCGPSAEHGLLVTAVTAEGRRLDATRRASFRSSRPEVVATASGGRLMARDDGEAEISVSCDGLSVRVRVRAVGTREAAVPSFRHEVVPVLTRAGCNQGACHGKEAGQNGFKLSLRGFAPEEDWERIAAESLGRRVNPAAPDLSLLLAKPSGRLPHKGGTLLAPDQPAYRLLARWIEAGAPRPRPDDPALLELELRGGGRDLRAGEAQQLLVRARFADGRTRDVTGLAQFFSNDATVLEAQPGGLVRALREGASSVRAHFLDRVVVASFTVPRDRPADPALFAERRNEVDRHVFDRLAALRIPPSGPSGDEEFLRRAYLDTIGTLPAPAEALAFLDDRSPDKRSRLVEALLARSEFSDFWAQWLGDLFQNRKERDHDVRGAKGVRSFHRWLRDQVSANRPWDALARDVLTAAGDTSARPEVGFWVVTVGEQRQADRSEAVASVAQTFLGTRILCAKCHNHPDERYTQDDYYHFAAFFTAVSLDRQKPEKGPTGLAVMTPQEREQRRQIEQLEKQVAQLRDLLRGKPEAEAQKVRQQMELRGKEMDQARKRMEEIRRQPVRAVQPRTGKALDPQPLDRAPSRVAPGEDPRRVLADWMTDPKNEYFSGAMVNRVWRHFMGVGLVEPVDDLRSSNPPSNAPLWRYLNEEFVRSGYDLRGLMRLILNSRAYQLASATRPENETDRRFYSRYYPKRLSAEVLLDAISQATGVPDTFPGYPAGLRAIQLPDPTVDSHFLRLFGRSDRVTACACERSGEVTLPQLLHLQNGEGAVQKIRSPEGRLAGLLKGGEPGKAVEALFLATLSRRPREPERVAVARMLSASKEPGEVLGDLFWALLNSKEFVFNH
jgi:hypothetical protein